jgi:hypothetical protein
MNRNAGSPFDDSFISATGKPVPVMLVQALSKVLRVAQ